MHTGIRSGARYQVLAASLRRQIISGEHAPGQLLASEHELARRKKVSRVTVRRASELLIQEGLLERRPGKGLYVREVAGSGAHGAKPVLPLQVIAGNLAWASCLQAGRGVQAAARADGVDVHFHDAHGSEVYDIEMIRRLPSSHATGAVIVSLHSTTFIDALYALKQVEFPFVLVDQRLRDLDVPSVLSDNRDGGRQLTRHLLGLGHRRLAFIGDLEADTVQSRLDGMRDAIGDGGLPFDRNLVIDLSPQDRLGDWSQAVHQAVDRVMIHAHRPTAIIASCDAVARAVYSAARLHGLRIPQDLSVVGFDDDPLATLLNPPLTTIRQPFFELGRAAYALVQARIAHPDAPVDHCVLPVELVVRSSTAHCPTRL